MLPKYLYMDDRTRAWLYEILKAIQEIESYFSDHQKNLEHFSKHIIKRRAVERNVETVGFFLSRIAKHIPDLKLSQVEKITDTSRRLRTGDGHVSNELLWDILANDLPRLKEEIHLMIIQTSQ